MAREVNEQEYRLIDRVTAGFNTIAAGLGRLKTGMTELNQTAELASKGLGLVVGAAQKIGDQIKGAADFESALAALRAVTAASAEDMAKLEAAAVNASKRTSFSALEAAQGLTELARAGLDATEAIDVLNPALNLAQGNSIAVSQSAELLTTTIKQFGQEMDQAARFADVLQATADGTSTSVEQIGNAMSYAAPLARQLGLSVEETSAIIGALADQGFRGERAGTALRNVFSSLLDPSSKFGEALRDLGIQSTDFSTVIQQLAAKGDGAKNALLALDAEARPAILSLVQGGGTAVADLTAKLKEAGGSAERTAQIMGDTFNGALSRFTNAFENARNALAAPILKPLADGLQQLADKLNEAAESGAFDQIGKKLGEFVSNAVPQIVDFISKFDFESAAKNVADFVSASIVLLDALAGAAKLTASAIGAVHDSAVALGEYDARVRGIAAATEAAGIPVGTMVQLLNDLGAGASDLANAPLADLQQRLGLTAEQARQLQADARAVADALPAIGTSAKSTAADLESFGQGALKLAERLAKITIGQAGVKALADAAGKLGAALGKVSEPAKLAEASVVSLQGALDAQIGTLRDAQLAYQKAFAAGTGGADAAWEAVKRAGSSVADLRRQLDAARSTTVGLTDAFKELGFQSQAALQETAQKGSAAFDAIAAAARRGEAAQSDVTRAFEEYARRLAATGELADESTRAQIARQIELKGRIAGVSEELIRASTEGLRAGSDIASAGDDAARSWTAVKTEAKESARSFREAAASAEESGRRAAEAAERTTAAMQAQRSIQIELNDGWREAAREIGVNVEAYDRLVENARIATDRLLSLSQRRRAAQEAEAKAAKEAAQATEPAPQQPQTAGAAGGLGNGPRPTGTQANSGTQPAQAAGSITQIFQIQGTWSADDVDKLAALLDRKARLAR